VVERADFVGLASAALDATTARQCLAETQQAVVVVERIARGGGATRWYVLGRQDDFGTLAARVRPGSRLSLYFDSRFLIGDYDHVREAIIRIIERDGEAVLGALRPPNIEAETDFPSSAEEADNFVRDHPDATIFVGAFPAAEHDGLNAITFELPDADGVVRQHPH
jgi:hypothetical protein